jgi:dTDP-4-amino-4,6-dideoxygalactose transaminase
MVDLVSRHARVAEALEPQLLEWIRSGRYIGGEWVSQCERRVSRAFGRKEGVGVANGTDALVLSLRALGIGPGDEVIVPALSFFATAGAVLLVGARPVVVDILPDRPLLDPSAAAAAISKRTRAVIAVHLFGGRCPDPALDLPVIEDSAQAIGQDPPVRLGCLTAVSFYPTKTLGGAGDGGLVATDDSELAGRLRALGNHGHVAGEAHLHESAAGAPCGNSRLDAVQALILCAHLDDVKPRIGRRRALARSYDAVLPPTIRNVPRELGHPVHQYVVRCNQRSALQRHLDEHGIDTAIYYPRSLAAQPALAPQGPTPIADQWAAELLALPCHIGVEQVDALRIQSALSEFQP